MRRSRFSNKYRTYGDWLKAQPRDTRYAKEIIRKHKLNPSATLGSLRKMRISDVSPAFSSFKILSPEQREMRTRALNALSEMRKGASLTSAAENQGINVKEALRHLGNAVYKKNGRWTAAKTDFIERGRWLYSDGKRVSVVIQSSEDASLISKYLNSVKIALKTGNEEILDPFKNVTIKGADGKEYQFETDLETLYELSEQVENQEFLAIYCDRI